MLLWSLTLFLFIIKAVTSSYNISEISNLAKPAFYHNTCSITTFTKMNKCYNVLVDVLLMTGVFNLVHKILAFHFPMKFLYS